MNMSFGFWCRHGDLVAGMLFVQTSSSSLVILLAHVLSREAWLLKEDPFFLWLSRKLFRGYFLLTVFFTEKKTDSEGS